MTNDSKIENVKNMIKKFGEVLREMPDSKLREEFNAFVYSLTFGSKSLPDMLEFLEKKISGASSTIHQDLKTNAKATVKFWNQVKDVLVKTYQENKDES